MAAPTVAVERSATRLLNRDLSDLAFIRRVLEEAGNPETPVLERLKLLGITGLLLDEFYRTRVTGLREQIRAGITKRSPDGLDPRAQLRLVDRASNELLADQDASWQGLSLDLGAGGISILDADALTADETVWVRDRIASKLAPRLKTRLIGAADPFPFIKDGTLFLVVELGTRDRDSPLGGHRASGAPGAAARRAIVPLPRDAERFVRLPGARMRFITLESVVRISLDRLFEDQEILEWGLARLVREGNLKLTDDIDDLLLLVREAVERREHAEVIRLEVDSRMPDHLGAYLAEALGLITREELAKFQLEGAPITASEFVAADRLLGLTDTLKLVEKLRGRGMERLRYAVAEPTRPAFVDEFNSDFFKAVASKDRLLHFPYDDFGVVLEFLRQAAEDPAVISIQQTLYRTGHDSPVVETLAHAARLGTRVTAVVELEAREDERENIELAEYLRRAGVSVVFGFRDLKVHVKALAIVREEAEGLRGYVNFATGNYHPHAARSYTDLSLFSADTDLAADAARLFDYLTGGSAHALPPGRDLATPGFRRIAIAPFGLRTKLLELIDREIAHAKAGKPAVIWIKVNKLSDPRLIRALYRASGHGVEIHAVVRGVCCLAPGLPGLSERIRVKSVVGQFLEHSRIVCFGNGHGLPSDSADVFLSSADWMQHKLDHRVEVLVPVSDADARQRIQQVVMQAYLRDEKQSWSLDRDGAWARNATTGYSAQTELQRHAP